MNAQIKRELERWDESPEMAVAILSRWKAQIKPKVSVKKTTRRAAEIMKRHRGGREVLNLDTAMGRQLYSARTIAMVDRQQGCCALCRRSITYTDATFDHEDGRGSGGSRRDDRIEVKGRWQNAALCWDCNSLKGSRRIPYAITQESVESRRDDTCQ